MIREIQIIKELYRILNHVCDLRVSKDIVVSQKEYATNITSNIATLIIVSGFSIKKDYIIDENENSIWAPRGIEKNDGDFATIFFKKKHVENLQELKHSTALIKEIEKVLKNDEA